MSKKRSKDQLIALILTSCQGDGASKTKIVYQVGLNFKTINPYLSLLTEKGQIVSEERDLTIYRTTKKGKQALDALKMVEEIYS
jgi:predicted transcriptional regulator